MGFKKNIRRNKDWYEGETFLDIFCLNRTVDDLISHIAGVSGKMTFDSSADRINNYWVYQLKQGGKKFTQFATIYMEDSTGSVIDLH